MHFKTTLLFAAIGALSVSASAVPHASRRAGERTYEVAPALLDVRKYTEPELEPRLLSSLTGAATKSTTSDQDAFLNAHNAFRAQHQAQPLVWNATLATFAKRYTDLCVSRHSGGPYGDNLYAGTGAPGPAKAVKGWTDEVSLYNFASPGYSARTGHFTQVVWKATRQLGCARSTCTPAQLGWSGNYGSTAELTLCEYWPRGNVIGKFPANVS